MRSRRRIALPALLGALLASCANVVVDPSADRKRARELIEEAIGRAEVFDPDAAPLSEDEISAILADGLSLDEALRLVLRNNRRLHAGFARMGIARAELVQSGLLANPSLSVAFLMPSGGGRPKLAFDVLESVVELWQLPQRKRVTEHALNQELLDVSRLAGELVADTRVAYFECVGARQLAAAARDGVELAQQSLAAVERRVEGGLATAIDENLARGEALNANIELRRAERGTASSMRELASLLSLERDLLDLGLSDALADPAPLALDREALVDRSRATRLDLRAARARVLAADAEVALERGRRLGALEAGVTVERPERGSTVSLLAGPTASLELPLFDRNQAQIARAEFRRDELAAELEALESDVAQQVRTAVDRASASERDAHFVSGELLAQVERNVELARASHELGRSTLLELLNVQRVALSARRAQIEALLEAAHARTQLERAIGVPLEALVDG